MTQKTLLQAPPSMNSMSNGPTNIVRELFAREVPEIMDGDVRIKAISREIGYRSKVAVQAVDETLTYRNFSA